ncbi:hypothetical protein AVEN_112562-1 [Araneus ventricosus]|uniref:Uncharacterized protein n=1 Tax=Araneus ventricosus TaxID=182803 RepID=A0A4Y2PYD5_ARAVE|nr:hypothetical protein AVEN_112562-1 [Araneus ventricosus]
MKMGRLYTRQGWLKNYGMIFIYPRSRVRFPLFVARFLLLQESSALIIQVSGISHMHSELVWNRKKKRIRSANHRCKSSSVKESKPWIKITATIIADKDALERILANRANSLISCRTIIYGD